MANVLILSLVFPPDGVSTAQIMAELAVDLRRSGHDVTVLTTQPHYNRDVVAEKRQPLAPTWAGLLYRSSYQGIPVFHTRMGRRSGGIAGRLGGWLAFHVLGVAAALRYMRRAEVIIVPSPLLSAGAMAWLLGVLTGARYIYNVQELYPDLAVKLGKLTNPAVIASLRGLERFVYRTAAAITPITKGMAARIVSRGVPEGKVVYLPNFVDVDDLAPMPRHNTFSEEHGLGGRFVVSYAGNMGHAQGLEVLIEAAGHLSDRPDIVFVLVGDGVARHWLVDQAKRSGLRNVVFVPHQPYSAMREIYAASDLSVVALLDTIETDAIPSKVYRIMACARPILAITSETSDVAALVREAGAGVVAAANARELAATIVRIAAAPEAERRAHGEAGRAWVLANVSRPAITTRYDALVRTIAAQPPDGAT